MSHRSFGGWSFFPRYLKFAATSTNFSAILIFSVPCSRAMMLGYQTSDSENAYDFFLGFFFFESDRPTHYQETHSTVNEKKKKGDGLIFCLWETAIEQVLEREKWIICVMKKNSQGLAWGSYRLFNGWQWRVEAFVDTIFKIYLFFLHWRWIAMKGQIQWLIQRR